MIMRFVRFFVGILLIPVCVAATRTLFSLVRAAQPASDALLPPSGLALVGGFLLWQLIYFTLPRPTRTYVLAHELSHALWGWLMQAKVHRIRIGEESGSVTLSKTNFLIILAPYFFPLYTVIVIAVYYALAMFFDVQKYDLAWLGLVGFTWGFHVTFTVSTLLQRQSDIRECGRLFSYTVIYTFNLLGVALWVVLVSRATLEQLVQFMARDFVVVGTFLWEKIVEITSGLGK